MRVCNKMFWVAVALLALVMAPSAQATPITGSIGFAGAATPTGGVTNTWSDATGIAFTNPAAVFAVGGTYAGLPTGLSSPPVTFTNLQFAPLVPSPVNPLWTFDYAGVTYSFELLSVELPADQGILPNGQSFLTLGGMGILSATGFSDTMGSFSFSSQGTGTGNFTFSASNVAFVPDGGTTLMLLGGALVGLGALRRKFRV